MKPSPPKSNRPSPARATSQDKSNSFSPIMKSQSSTIAAALQELESQDYRKSPTRESKPKRRIITQSSTALTGFDMPLSPKRPLLRQDSNDSQGSLRSFGSDEADPVETPPLFAEDEVKPFVVREGVESHIVADMNQATGKLIEEKVSMKKS